MVVLDFGDGALADESTVDTQKDKVGVDDILEDAFGLSMRGLHTLKASFVSPAKAFAAARMPDWNDRSYTPSIRLVFSLLAVLTAIRFLWTSKDSMFYQSTVIAIEQAGTDAFGPDLDAAIASLMDIYVVIFPLAYIGFQILGALLCRVWGTGTTFPARLRLYFLGIVPSTIYTVLVTVCLSFVSYGVYLPLLGITIVGTWFLDLATSLRGGVQGSSMHVRALKAALFATMSFSMGMLANFGAFIGAQIWFIYWPWQ